MVAVFKVKWLYLKQLHGQINGMLFIVQFMFFVHNFFCQLYFLEEKYVRRVTKRHTKIQNRKKKFL